MVSQRGGRTALGRATQARFYQVTFRLADDTGEPPLAGRQLTLGGTPASVNSSQTRARGSPARIMAAAHTASRHRRDSRWECGRAWTHREHPSVNCTLEWTSVHSPLNSKPLVDARTASLKSAGTRRRDDAWVHIRTRRELGARSIEPGRTHRCDGEGADAGSCDGLSVARRCWSARPARTGSSCWYGFQAKNHDSASRRRRQDAD